MIKKILLIVLSAIMLVSLGSCNVSSYSAIGLVKVTRNDYAKVSFAKLNGKLVLTPRYTGDNEGQIHYKASLEKGEINVYYEGISGKELLFNIKAGEELDNIGGSITKGTQKIIIETVSAAKGSITVEFV